MGKYKWIKVFLIMMGASATTHLTIAMFLVSNGAKEVCFTEPNLWISIPEFILGIFTIVFLCYLAIQEVSEKETNGEFSRKAFAMKGY